jgi:hypothetical protein
MPTRKYSLRTFILFCAMVLGSVSHAPAMDPNSKIQDRYSAPVIKQVPSTARQPQSKWDNMTTDQKFSALLGKLDTLERKITTLQNQAQPNSLLRQEVTQLRNTVQQLSQVITISSAGHVTIQTGQNLKLAAGVLEISASNVKVQAAISGFHGVLKADTMITNSVVSSAYTPGAGNIW